MTFIPRQKLTAAQLNALAAAAAAAQAAAAAAGGKLGGLAASPADHATAADLELAALPKRPAAAAYDHDFLGPDGGLQLRVTYTPKAVEDIRIAGGIQGAGPVVAAWSDTRADVSGTLAAKGAGGWFAGNGSGVLGGFADNGLGTRAEYHAVLVPGAKGGAATLSARAVNGDTRVPLALVPGADGALVRTAPDNAVGGGVVRGPNAVDWQAARGFATQVAQASHSAIGGGLNNEVSGFASAIGGGSNNRLAGQYSWCPGGSLFNDRGRQRTGGFGAGQFGTLGDNQAGDAVMRATSTSATPVRLTTDGTAAAAGTVFDLPNNGLFTVELLLQARQQSGTAGAAGDAAWRKVVFSVKRGANAAASALVGSAATLASGADAAAAAWAWTVAADTTLGGFSVSFAGEANKTVRTNARLLSIELQG